MRVTLYTPLPAQTLDVTLDKQQLDALLLALSRMTDSPVAMEMYDSLQPVRDLVFPDPDKKGGA